MKRPFFRSSRLELADQIEIEPLQALQMLILFPGYGDSLHDSSGSRPFGVCSMQGYPAARG
ncbi:MAG: hypothetical protein KJ709_01725 [Nanoarchaeota archaeon]|nr:hypothetical protein [Nanoarchaeota archaeon]